jgi:hypothetical protein
MSLGKLIQNRIRINKGINASNFDLSKSGSSIKIQSQTNLDKSIAIDFKDFKIETITSMVEKDLQINGNINGKALIKI